MIREFKGILPAIASPCDENNVFLEERFATLVENLYNQSIDGLYVCGATGDGANMKPEERKRAAGIAVSLSKKNDVKVIVHVGASDSSIAIELAEHASLIGADAVSSMPHSGMDQKQLVKYYKDISKASQLPVFVYHIPHLTNRTSTVQEIVELLDIEGVAGLKITDWNLFFMKRLLFARPQITVFNGFDELLFPAMIYGAHGGIGMWYNLFPGVFSSIYKNVLSGNLEVAADLQNKLLSFLDKAWKYGVVQAFETIMRARGLAPFCFRNKRFYVDIETQNKILKETELAEQSLLMAAEKNLTENRKLLI